MKGSSSRMKNKMGAQMGAFIKMKQEKVYVYQLFYVVCYVPIIALTQQNPLKTMTKGDYRSQGTVFLRDSMTNSCRYG